MVVVAMGTTFCVRAVTECGFASSWLAYTSNVFVNNKCTNVRPPAFGATAVQFRQFLSLPSVALPP